MVQAVCCPKVEQPDLHIDTSRPCPRLIPFRCTHGENASSTGQCKCCGVEKGLGILEAQDKEKKMANKTLSENCTQWISQSVTSLSASRTSWKFAFHITRRSAGCASCRTPISHDSPDTMLIFTDFASTMALRARLTKNSSVDGHAVNDKSFFRRNYHQREKSGPCNAQYRSGRVSPYPTISRDAMMRSGRIRHSS